MSKPLNMQILEQARAKVANPKTWRKRHTARMENGRPAAGRHDLVHAVKFCGFGAIYKTAYDHLGDIDLASAKTYELERMMLRGAGIAAINDGKNGRKNVLALFDEHLAKMKT